MVKAVDSKSTGFVPRRFESCMRRIILLLASTYYSTAVAFFAIFSHKSVTVHAFTALGLSTMGKKKNRKRSADNYHGYPEKKQRMEGYWIDVCHDSNPKEGKPPMTVFITQVDLTDDHFHVSQDKGESKAVALKEAPTAAETLKTGDAPMENSSTRAETMNYDANLEAPDAAISPENAKQIDFNHAFISVKRMPSSSASFSHGKSK